MKSVQRFLTIRCLFYFFTGLLYPATTIALPSPSSVTTISLDATERAERKSIHFLNNQAFFKRPIKCHILNAIATDDEQHREGFVLDRHTNNHLTVALQNVFCDMPKLEALLSYLHEQNGLFVALAQPIASVLIHFSDQANELEQSFLCIKQALEYMKREEFILFSCIFAWALERHQGSDSLLNFLAISVPAKIGRLYDNSPRNHELDIHAHAPCYDRQNRRILNYALAYDLLKHAIIDLPWQNPMAFKYAWHAYWTQAPSLNVYQHHEFLVRALCELWQERPHLHHSATKTLHNKYFVRLYDKINRAAQNQAVPRDVRLLLSTENLMRYVDTYLGRHRHKENFKRFLRCSTFSQDAILPL